MELTKEQREAIDGINDWHKWVMTSLLDGDEAEVSRRLYWLRENVNAACKRFGVDKDRVAA